MSEMSKGLVKVALMVADPKNDRQFMHLVICSMQELNLTDKDVAEMIGVSIPTVERWKNGKNAPHPAMRPVIYKEFIKRLDALK